MSSTQIRSEIILLLGNKCANPYSLKDCSTKEFVGGKSVPNRKYTFKIDHISGFGNRDRKKCENKNGNMNCYKYYKTILDQIKNGSKDFQLLCCVCDKYKTGLEAKEMREFVTNKCPNHHFSGVYLVTASACWKCEQKEECRYRRY